MRNRRIELQGTRSLSRCLQFYAQPSVWLSNTATSDQAPTILEETAERNRQPAATEMKTPRPSNKLPDQVRDAIRLKRSSIRTACPKACGELVGPYAEGNKPMSIGSNATSSFTTSAVPRIWGAQKSRPSSLTSPWSETSLPLARIRPPALPGMAISKALRLKDAGTVARLPAAVGHRAFTANCAAPEQPISRMWISRVTMHHLLIDQLPISWQLRPHRAETPYSCPDPATLWPKPT